MEKIMLFPGKAPYETDFAPFLTAYPVEGARGAVIVCPGGGYNHKAAHEGGPVAEMLNGAGIAAYVLDYRIAPCDPQAPLCDANRAVRLVRSMGYEKVAILGFSAGGHLACCAAVMYDGGDPGAEDPVERYSSRPDAFIPCYAVSSFVVCRHGKTMDCLLGDRKDDSTLARAFSPDLHITADTPEAFIWHTAEDGSVPVGAALNLARSLSARGVPYALHIWPEGHHGLGLAKELPAVSQWADLLCQWLGARGYGK